jgi:hypothetical protein
VIIETTSPELSEVAGADNLRILVTRVPCGTCYSTEFLSNTGALIRQDQHVIVDKMPPLFGTAQY